MALTLPHVFCLFFPTFVSFIFLTLITFSLPISKSLYFLYASEAGGVRFGIWGWCLDSDPICMNPMRLGYTWEPQIATPITSALILFPIASVLCFLTILTLIPISSGRPVKNSGRVFMGFSLFTFFVAKLAFIFTIAMWAIAKTRFRRAGFKSHFGSLPWLSLFAMLLLLLAVILGAVFLKPLSPQVVQMKDVKGRPSRSRYRSHS
ncbi:uncharacterized protein LACBIDRAFT_317946 [Laccaria bicolor S238N-H82]|uniref:Predicted protein n=1 Tax=Laccaria bicolor (strain S238N-H82 / ATCC MYA-4686) TaxID=486041 RepID=B0D5K8_LACBS|nr:uncharacterized protein LACBIDRAFT_317946 [Laccaria bicolor S238N-H82]EDR10037.1 predicted protein [Laccaria bicolor S238N-H82]|eukprot:XP_001879422.1 predicted protein [Laccaria bicolor S238N-H82]